MEEDARTRRWQKISLPATPQDPLQALRSAIAAIRSAPRDPEARRRVRALGAEQGMWEQLALLLADEARAAAGKPEVAAAFFEELADVHENLDQPLEQLVAMEEVVELAPDDVEHLDRLAWLYRRVGAWAKAAQAFERVARLARDDRARAALRAAGKIYRDNARLDLAVQVYRSIVKRWPNDKDAWRALDEILTELGRWQELAEARGALAGRAAGGIEKAVHLRAQARALERAGDPSAAAALVAKAAHHAPEDVSGLVDYATVLAREGRGREAVEILGKRVAQAVADGAPAEDIAAMQMRLVAALEDACHDRGAAAAVLDKLLAVLPEYVPALERVVQHASHDPDPRVHAAALLRYAAALSEGPDKTAAVIEAARRYAVARDFRSAARVFEDAIDLDPENEALREELDSARTALVVDRVTEEVAAGDKAGAVRRLQKILATRPQHIEAHLALVDLLEPAQAIEHMREALEQTPDDTPPDRLALLVHRYAIAVAAGGDADQAHQLLHEAHHLDRKNLLITLALGESCFARRLWREAALQLGKLAEHPDAPNHATAVASGLVHAALAEIRALRPANAQKRYEAAVKLDPKCGRAWHALAEIAIEHGDLARAAECLELEATAAQDPRDRLRLWDALGDLALDVLEDPARAERCWLQVADANHVPLLDKLLAAQRRRGAGVERAETCERLAELTPDKRANKELTEEAAEAYAAGGDAPRAREAAKRLMASFPTDIDAVVCASAIAHGAGDHEKVAAWLTHALAAWDASGDRGDGDPRRADLWRRLGDAERARGDQRGALTAYQRAVITAPEADGALAARRGLVDLAATSGRSAITSLVALVEADQDPDDVIAWARQLAGHEPEDARAAYELARALGANFTADDERFLAANQPKPMASDQAYAAALDEADPRELIDDPEDAPLGEVLELLGEIASLVSPDVKSALFQVDLDDAVRVTSANEAAAVVLYPQIANALNGPQTLLYATKLKSAPDLTLLLAAPPVIVIGPRLASIRAQSQSDARFVADAELRFKLGRVVELARPRRVFAAGNDYDAFDRLVRGLCHAFGRQTDVEPQVASEAERLRSMLPVQLRRRMSEKLAAVGSLDPTAYLAACERAADRAGLLVCGDVSIAIELAGGPHVARHLVRLAGNPRYLSARRKLRSRKTT